MTIKELIDQIKDLPPNDHVFIWVDGERYAVADIDIDLGDNYIDLNAEVNK